MGYSSMEELLMERILKRYLSKASSHPGTLLAGHGRAGHDNEPEYQLYSRFWPGSWLWCEYSVRYVHAQLRADIVPRPVVNFLMSLGEKKLVAKIDNCHALLDHES